VNLDYRCRLGSISYLPFTYNRPRNFCLSLILIRKVCLIPMLMIAQFVTKLSTFTVVHKPWTKVKIFHFYLTSIYYLFVYLLMYFLCSDPLLSSWFLLSFDIEKVIPDCCWVTEFKLLSLNSPEESTKSLKTSYNWIHNLIQRLSEWYADGCHLWYHFRFRKMMSLCSLDWVT
jgi:hypothetical protein